MATAVKGKAAQEKGQERQLEIIRQANTALFTLRFKGGGELPDTLKDCYYTSTGLAQKAIADYKKKGK